MPVPVPPHHEDISSIGSELSEQPTESSELVGILAAMFILTLVLGSLVAMGMPIISAVAGLGIALATVGLMGHLVAMPDTGATLATMIGLGVGIDYALFLVTRHQEQLEAGMPVEDSIARAVATSGSAIVFAGGTVVVAPLADEVRAAPEGGDPGSHVGRLPAGPDPGARRRVGLLRDRPLGAHHHVEMSVAQYADHAAAPSGGCTRPAVTQDRSTSAVSPSRSAAACPQP